MTTGAKKSIITYRENFTGFQPFISSDHTYIHAGLAYTIALDLGSISAAYHIALETPAASSAYIHYRPSAAGVTTDADNVEFQFREGITSYTGGTAYTPFNRNRVSSNTSTVTVKYGVTPTVGTPTTLDVFSIGTAGNAASRGGGQSGGGDAEIILKPSTTYLFTFTPAGATNVTFNIFWYEESMGA